MGLRGFAAGSRSMTCNGSTPRLMARLAVGRRSFSRYLGCSAQQLRPWSHAGSLAAPRSVVGTSTGVWGTRLGSVLACEQKAWSTMQHPTTDSAHFSSGSRSVVRMMWSSVVGRAGISALTTTSSPGPCPSSHRPWLRSPKEGPPSFVDPEPRAAQSQSRSRFIIWLSKHWVRYRSFYGPHSGGKGLPAAVSRLDAR